jgi:hypothetical protein
MKKTIIHITAGDDRWTPTEAELKAIANKFRRAMKATTPTHTPVVPTRNAVKVEIIEYDPVQYATTGYLTTYTNQGNPNVAPVTPGFQPYTISHGNQQ